MKKSKQKVFNQAGFIQLLVLLLLIVLLGVGAFVAVKYRNLEFLSKVNLTGLKKVLLLEEEQTTSSRSPSATSTINLEEVKKSNEGYFSKQQEQPHPSVYTPTQ